jgi:hypothetical protein
MANFGRRWLKTTTWMIELLEKLLLVIVFELLMIEIVWLVALGKIQELF